MQCNQGPRPMNCPGNLEGRFPSGSSLFLIIFLLGVYITPQLQAPGACAHTNILTLMEIHQFSRQFVRTETLSTLNAREQTWARVPESTVLQFNSITHQPIRIDNFCLSLPSLSSTRIVCTYTNCVMNLKLALLLRGKRK